MKLSISDQQLKIQFSLLEKIFAFHGSFTLPLQAIKSVSTVEPLSGWWDLRAPGTFLPGVIRAGTYYTKRGKEFWYVTTGGKKGFLQIDLNTGSYKRIILFLPDNQKWADTIQSRIS